MSDVGRAITAAMREQRGRDLSVMARDAVWVGPTSSATQTWMTCRNCERDEAWSWRKK